jgi:hypothetical protein
MRDYTIWTLHGEVGQNVAQENNDDVPMPSVSLNAFLPIDDYQCYTVPVPTNDNVFRNTLVDDTEENDGISQFLHDVHGGFLSATQLKKLEIMRKDAKTPLYPTCPISKLEANIMLLEFKSTNGLSDKGFDSLLGILHKLLPKGSELPEKTYLAKQMICPIGLEVEKIHACSNDCILYRGEKYKDLDACPKCKAPRYKQGPSNQGSKTRGGPIKVVWYFPIAPRVHRLFANAKSAKLLRWHGEERKKDTMLRHPADGSDWRTINTMFYKNIGGEVRHLWIGLSTDGMNPFDQVRSNHSTWPVTLCIYNLPPWLCMKRSYIQMPLLIQGPKQPGNDIDVLLQPVIDELLQMWETGVKDVWDEYKKEHVTIKAILIATITDLPGRGCLSGEKTKGYTGCVECLDETDAIHLPENKKMVYMGHRRFLRRDHPYRRNRKDFNGTTEKRGPPKYRDGKQILKQVSKLTDVVLGKGEGAVPAPAGSIWKKKSIFWELPYWPLLSVRHCLDPMHITKNVCGNTLNMLMNTGGTTKDSLATRLDMQHLGLRKELHPITLEDGHLKLPVASWTLKKEEKAMLISFFNDLKVPTGYCANPKRLVNMRELKFNYGCMKAHDCHVIMTQLLPVALRGILPDKVRAPIIKLCSFFNAISEKVIEGAKLDQLKQEITEILCRLEMHFPPTYFDISVHLLVHLVDQIKALGPMYLHQMFPFERLMKVFRRYVRNRFRPEGSMVEGWTTEEAIEFCTYYMDINRVGVPVSRHDGRLGGKGTIGEKAVKIVEVVSFRQAHFAVLQQADGVMAYINEHKQLLQSKHIGRSQAWLEKKHKEEFGDWFRRRRLGMVSGCQLDLLAPGPSTTVMMYQGYDINGFTFYTKKQDGKSTNQNSAVRFDAHDEYGTVEATYYGFIDEIWELDYGRQLKVALFRCQWVRLDEINTDNDGFTTVDLSKTAYRDDPFVLAKDVLQIFYARDNNTKGRLQVVMQGKRKIVGVEGVTDEEEYKGYQEMAPFGADITLPILEEGDEPAYLRSDHDEAIIVRIS